MVALQPDATTVVRVTAPWGEVFDVTVATIEPTVALLADPDQWRQVLEEAFPGRPWDEVPREVHEAASAALGRDLLACLVVDALNGVTGRCQLPRSAAEIARARRRAGTMPPGDREAFLALLRSAEPVDPRRAT